MNLSFETVIGLEVHVQLSTESKLFCLCPTAYIGVAPNTNICPLCLGLPGSLPTLNRRAIELGIRAALALNCSVNSMTKFHRKNYFYPDLPKAYQISQYDIPLAVSGSMPVNVGGEVKNVGITRLHLEEDAGKLVHSTVDGRLSGASFSLVDYNRSGIPLAEIVSEPELSSPEEAREYVIMLRRLVRYLGVSDGDMESGSLRVDGNISQKCSDGRWGSRVEIKNLNSLRSLERALEFEIARQRRLLLDGEVIVQETRHWDDGAGVTCSSRGKEEAHDYRYFPEPDLPPVRIDGTLVESIRNSLPELPWDKRDR
jgi:aspartyl-tRNA(Asn)/glutamyl-tRNA(Gln) amidotransferase subunit B